MAVAWVPFIGQIVAVGPAACVLAHEAAIRGGQILLLVHGWAKDAVRARQLLSGALSPTGR